jgi:16S rRNA (guanine966-N2)-methyltransferase
VRIIAGEWRGRVIEAPQRGTRPTADRVREALFSMLASRLGSFEELRVADLFAGSGALGLEALSRGAASATFVEKENVAIAIIRRNAEKLGAGDRIQVVSGSALSLPKSGTFDLILADPPYAAGSGTETLKSVLDAGWAAPGCWIAIETQRGDSVEPPPDVTCEVERDVGRARLTLLRYS